MLHRRNRARVLARVGGKEAHLKVIVKVFQEECPKSLAAIRDAIPYGIGEQEAVGSGKSVF